MGNGLTEWLVSFRRLHERARRGELREPELTSYRASRDELARALLAAQKLQLKPGELPRQALRVARALQVDLDFGTSAQRAVTCDISTGGFSCLLAKAPPLGDEAKVSLRLPGTDAFAGRARVQDVKPNQGNVRVSFAFVGASSEDQERIELFVFDTVLEHLAAPG